MGKKIEDRKLFLGGPWDVIKGKNPVLSKGLFKPPMDPVVSKFDDVLDDYKKQVDKKKELAASIKDLTAAVNPHIDAKNKLADERDKIFAKDSEQRNKDGDALDKMAGTPDTDPADVIAALEDYTTAASDALNSSITLNAQIQKHSQAIVDAFKKFRDGYKSKADAITAAIKKDEAEADKLEAQIRQIIAGYQKTATQMDNDSLIDDVRSLLDKL